jgi:hypothetical protein
MVTWGEELVLPFMKKDNVQQIQKNKTFRVITTPIIGGTMKRKSHRHTGRSVRHTRRKAKK